MQLRGKCLEDFGSWLFKNYNDIIIKREAGDWNHGGDIKLSTYDIFDEIPTITRNVLIIEFFDSVGIYCFVDCQWSSVCNIWWRSHISKKGMEKNIISSDWENRTQAIQNSILIANELYNKNYDLV